jgi:hypothetical protein
MSLRFYGFTDPAAVPDAPFVESDRSIYLFDRLTEARGRYLPKGAKRYLVVAYSDGEEKSFAVLPGSPYPVEDLASSRWLEFERAQDQSAWVDLVDRLTEQWTQNSAGISD